MPFEKMPIASSEAEDLEKQLEHMKPMGLADPFFDTPSSENKEVHKRGPRGAVYTERVATYLTKEMATRLADYCRKNGVTPATAGRMAFQKLLGVDTD